MEGDCRSIMGFWRGVGYFWAILMIIGGLLLFPFGIISMILGAVLIVYLQNSAKNEKIEKHLQKIAGMDADATERALYKEWKEKRSRHELE